MFNYGIGGNEVKGDASEAFADIQQNRTLMIEKLTDNAPVKPQIVEGLTNVEAVFEHFKPNVDVEFRITEEDYRIRGPGDILGKTRAGFPGFDSRGCPRICPCCKQPSRRPWS